MAESDEYLDFLRNVLYKHVSDETAFRQKIEQFRDFIDTHKRVRLIDYTDTMSKEQIDILFEFKPCMFREKEHRYLYSRFLYGEDDNLSYILQKFLEQDDEFLFITREIRMFNHVTQKCESGLFLDVLCDGERQYAFGMRDSERERMIMLLQNHQKKYYRLFDLLKHHID